MKLRIIAEGELNEGVMKRLLACHPRLREHAPPVVMGDGHYEVRARAHPTLTRRGIPVAVVLNTDSDPETPYNQRWLIEVGLGTAAPSCEWSIVLFEPNVEGWLLRQPTVQRALLPAEPGPELLQRLRTEPRAVLAELFTPPGESDFRPALLKRLAEVDLSPLWATKELRALEQFLLEKLLPEEQEEQFEEAPAPA
jgi:hypothetical protein